MRAFYEKYKIYFPATFFIGGFVFDILTTDRIDHWLSLVQQLAYILAIMLFMYWEITQPRIFREGPKFFRFIWKYHVEALHFFFGCLLSLYAIFYFKAASLTTSFAFMGVLATLLVINELASFQGLGVAIRFTMLALCLTSYFIYLVPVVSGEIGLFPFVLAVVISVGIYFWFIVRLERKAANPDDLIYRGLIPGVIINLIFCGMYLLKMLPPVPLSLKYIGMYHKVERSDGQYKLFYEQADWWRFWESGAQTFLYEKGDKVFVYVQIFSPTNFKDTTHLDWYHKGVKGWKKWDEIPLPISGGSSKGYRGYAYKANFTPGEWHIRVLTSDNREMGRIYFTIVERPPSQEARLFKFHIR
jgi:hypothetical protein